MSLDRSLSPPDREEPENTAEEIVSWVVKTYLPEDIYPYSALENWALKMGWILPETKTNTY